MRSRISISEDSKIYVSGESRVYKLYNTKTDDFYIGSTLYSLAIRKACHIWEASKNENEKRKLYAKMREVGIDFWEMEELSVHNDISIQELREIERKAIEELRPNLNIRSPIVTNEERRIREEGYSRKILLCGCGTTYTYRNKTNHIRTAKHKKYLKEKELVDHKEMIDQSHFD